MNLNDKIYQMPHDKFYEFIMAEYSAPDPTGGEVIAAEARSVFSKICDALADV